MEIMKKYPIFNKYFNREPKGWLLFGLIYCVVMALVAFALLLFSRIEYSASDFSVIILPAVVFVFLLRIYISQFTLKDARVGKFLKKYYGLEGDVLEATLDSIEGELVKPVYSDANNKKRAYSLFITENWVVGSDGMGLLRANVCKISDIVDMQTTVLSQRRRRAVCYYYVLRIKDKNDYQHDFCLRSAENAELALQFLTKHLGKEA